jgi:hypothetical protein
MHFYHNWTNSILQQLKRKFCKIAESSVFRISWRSNSFTQYMHTGVYHPYSFVPDPQISGIEKPPPSVGGNLSDHICLI